MDRMETRRFKHNDAIALSNIISINLLEVNTKDYPKDEMKRLAKAYSPEKVQSISESAHMYVVYDHEKVVGCGAIASYDGKLNESILITIFVLPEMHGQGIGKRIMQALESDEYSLRANRIEISSSITACEFYKSLGYYYKEGFTKPNEDGLYVLEKFRHK